MYGHNPTQAVNRPDQDGGRGKKEVDCEWLESILIYKNGLVIYNT